jgi:transcriptional regulator with XRE-family HTH domain
MEKSTHTPEYSFLRSQLRAARETAGLSQRELSSRLQVPHSWIAKVETGERRIDLVEFCWFVSACGLDPIPICNGLLQQFLKKQSSRQAKGGRSK